MHHLGVPMNEHLIKQDTNYAEIMTQAKKRRTASISPRMGPPRCTLDHYFLQTPMDRNPADPTSQSTPEVQQQQHTIAKTVLNRGTQSVELPVQEISSEPDGSDDPIAADQAELAEAWTPDPLDYDDIIQQAKAWMLQPSTQNDLWDWIITTDFSHLSSMMHLSNMIATLYPAFPVKLTGGRYSALLADDTVVRFLSTRCILCDHCFPQCSDLFIHHNLVHGCIPTWSLQQFHVGLGCLYQHLRTLDLPHLSDQDIWQLGQIVILRIHCAQLHGHGGGGELPADDGHLVSCAAQGSAETLLGYRPPGNRKTPQGQEASEEAGTGGTRVNTAAQSHGDTTPTSRGQHQMLEPRHGIHGSLESRPRIDLGRTHDSLQRLDQPQGENSSIAAPSGGDNDGFTSAEIHNFDRSPARERASQKSIAISAPGHLQPVSFSKLESREEATDQVKDTSFANGGGSQDDSGDQRMPSRLSGDFEVPQLEENVQRDGQSSALPVDGEPQSSTQSMAPIAAFSLSQFLAAHSGSPSTSQSSAQSVSKNPSATAGEALRPFVNSNGVNCFANSSCLGLAWLSQVIGVEAMDWSDKGYFKQTCFEAILCNRWMS